MSFFQASLLGRALLSDANDDMVIETATNGGANLSGDVQCS
jgi:hypothetical protein